MLSVGSSGEPVNWSTYMLFVQQSGLEIVGFFYLAAGFLQGKCSENHAETFQTFKCFLDLFLEVM